MCRITMAIRLLVLGLLHTATAMPAITLQDLELVGDDVSVGTYIRAVRAPPLENFYKSYEREGDGEIGYSRKKIGGGKKGYQHFDTYQKKGGDHYELETEDSYGQHEHDHAGAYSQNHEKKENYRKPKAEDAEIIEDPERVKDDRPDIEHEELKQEAPDGNGGVEAHGHDPKDYILPEKYSYGAGEEYDF